MTTPLSKELKELLEASDPSTLLEMVLVLTKDNEAFAKSCRAFLDDHHIPTPERARRNADAQARSLWDSIEVDLSDMDEYGGADEDTVDEVYATLEELAEVVANGRASQACRQEIQSLAMVYLDRDNAGMADPLTELVMACCESNDEWRALAKVFENRGSYSMQLAMGIYRQIGDHERYLSMRHAHLDSSSDYLDLAGFYTENGQAEKALEWVEHALEIGRKVMGSAQRSDPRWRLDELIAFLSDHARQTGDRAKHTALEYEKTVLHLTFESYLAFEKHCSVDEWEQYEDQVVKHLPRAWPSAQVDIYLHRKDFAQALAVLTSGIPSASGSIDATARKHARSLESHYPQEILAYYLKHLGKFERDKRSVYADKARALSDIRRVLVEILQDEKWWQTIVNEVLTVTQNLPACRDELQKNVPGWPRS